MRVTLGGPDGWARGWISNWHKATLRLRCQQDEGGVLVWVGIIKDELLMSYFEHQNQLPNLLPVFRRHFFQAVVQEKVCIFQEDHDFDAGQCSIAFIKVLHCVASQ